MPLFNALWEKLLVPSMEFEGLLGSTLSEHLISFHFPLILTGKTGIQIAITAKIISSLRLEFLITQIGCKSRRNTPSSQHSCLT